MRTLSQNKQKMYFSNPGNFNYLVDQEGNFVVDNKENYIVDSEVLDIEVPVYETDDEGNVITEIIDGEEIPVIIDYWTSYGMPFHFYANISFNSGETRMAEYGLNDGDYDAIIVAEKGKFPFTEQTLIWHKSKPRYNEQGIIKPESADYRVVAIKTSLNTDRFALKKRVDTVENNKSTIRQ